MSEDRFYKFISDLAAPRWDRTEPVVRVAGRIGSAVGTGIGWFLGWTLIVIFYVSVWFVWGLYIFGSALRAWLNEEYRSEHQRRNISQRVRYQIAKSQEWMCYYGDMRLQTGFHIDHKYPVSDVVNYGTDPDEIEDLSNLVATCPKHNLQKGNMDEEEFWEWMEENDQESCNAKLGD